MMEISSSDFIDGEAIPARYTCDGDDINPQLEISDVPIGAVSLALIMDDPDVPKDVPKDVRSDGIWDHWIVFNIPIDTKIIAENSKPAGVRGRGTSDNLDYHGPCPPDKEHRYFLKLYALDIELDLSEGADKADVELAMEEHIIEKAVLIGTYNRK